MLDWPKFFANLAYSIISFIALIFKAHVLREEGAEGEALGGKVI